MAQRLDLRNTARDENGRLAPGSEGGNAALRDLAGMVTSYNPPPAPQPFQTVQQRAYDLLYARREWLSRSQIADALKLKKTPYLHRALDQMAADGHLNRFEGRWKNGAVMYFYSV